MSHDTTSVNKQRQALHEYDDIWVFGYGSLIYKIDFPYIKKQSAHIHGWLRRFWQGSHDHRGTYENPGRVVTLVAGKEEETCDGIAFKVDHNVFDHLDHREKNGYLRHEMDLHFGPAHAPEGNSVKGLIYIAAEDNAAFLGPASEFEIAEHIFRSRGPSGCNREYVYLLANALRELGEEDEHVFAIEQHLKTLERSE